MHVYFNINISIICTIDSNMLNITSKYTGSITSETNTNIQSTTNIDITMKLEAKEYEYKYIYYCLIQKKHYLTDLHFRSTTELELHYPTWSFRVDDKKREVKF